MGNIYNNVVETANEVRVAERAYAAAESRLIKARRAHNEAWRIHKQFLESRSAPTVPE